MRRLLEWLDQRTGCKDICRDALYENVPGGARWRYIWGSALVFALFVQFVTGLFLWMAYSPSVQSAWESVYFIQYEMSGGWFLRGLHHYTAHIMTVLLALHLMQVIIDGAYKAPREVNFWFGLILLLLTMALSLTGYLLPWDQKGYWATKVTASLMAQTPVIGSALQRLFMGGAEFGHHTLTRFFALHAGLIPALIVVLVVGHVYLFRRHGLTPRKPLKKPDQPFWPDQLLKDSVAALAVLATAIFLIVLPRMLNSEAPLGAPLGAPADPSEPYDAARPEWYFLFLFQFLKYFPGDREILGAIVIPSLVLLVLFLIPFIGRWRIGHFFNGAFLIMLLVGAIFLTARAYLDDGASETYQVALKDAETKAARVKLLARAPAGIPQAGALELLRTDPLTQGPALFAKHCASCHRYDGHNGLGVTPVEDSSAPDLKGFASRQWISGFLDPEKINTDQFFGGTEFEGGKMARFTKNDIGDYDEEQMDQLAQVIIALSAEAELPSQQAEDLAEAELIRNGRVYLRDEMACTDCHQFREPDDTATAPDLTGYGSAEWLRAFIADPEAERFYGSKNDRMPSFGADEIMTDEEIDLLVDWLRGDWYREGAEPAAVQAAQAASSENPAP